MYLVPQAVRSMAEDGLRLHREHPLDDVGGVRVAEALATGEVGPEVVARMRRFFVTNERHYMHEAALSHSAVNSALVRSWNLHGGHAGKTWADVTYCEARRSGFIEEDPWVTLLKLTPSQVYERFAFNAWRWEYGLTPQRAARFVEEYHRSTGMPLDIAKAFGAGRNAVSEAIIRRVQNANPFALVARTLLRDTYRAASERDMAEMKKSIGRPALNWPSLVGFGVLASRDPKAAKAVVEGTVPPPAIGDRPAPLMAYSEPVAAYAAYLHPRGARWVSNAPTGLITEASAFFRAAYTGQSMREDDVRETLAKARAYTGSNALAWNLGHTLLEAWRRRDWDLLLEAVPLDSPVRLPLERHVGVRTSL